MDDYQNYISATFDPGVGEDKHFNRAPDRVLNAALATPSAASTSVNTVLIGRPQLGKIRSLSLILTNAQCTTPGNTLTIALQNTLGNIYFQHVISLIATPLAALIWAFTDLDVQFTDGLVLQITTGAASAGNQGLASLNVVWAP